MIGSSSGESRPALGPVLGLVGTMSNPSLTDLVCSVRIFRGKESLGAEITGSTSAVECVEASFPDADSYIYRCRNWRLVWVGVLGRAGLFSFLGMASFGDILAPGFVPMGTYFLTFKEVFRALKGTALSASQIASMCAVKGGPSGWFAFSAKLSALKV
ncbi:hypothetical protein Tco_1471278 [Tanacetum coccineum]